MNKTTAIVLTCLVLAACAPSGDETNSEPQTLPKGEATLTISAVSGVSLAPAAASATTSFSKNITIETANAVISQVNLKGWEPEVEGPGDDDGEEEADELDNEVEGASTLQASVEDEAESDSAEEEEERELDEVEDVDFEGPFRVDLLSGVSTPPIESVPVPLGEYRAVEFKLDAEEEGVEDESEAASLEIGGKIVIDGVTYDFALRDREDREFKWRFPSPVTVSADTLNDLVLRIPLDSWIDQNLAAALADAYRSGRYSEENGTLVFTTDDSELEGLLEANRETEGEFDREDD